jgi:hypothetical protein
MNRTPEEEQLPPLPPPPLKRISTWVGTATAGLGLAALSSPEVTRAIIVTAQDLAGNNAVGVSLVTFGTTQALLAARRWLQARAARSRSA